MISRLIDLPLQQNTMESAKLATIVITPNLEGYTSADFLKGTEMIPLGYKAAEAAAGEARGVVGARERLRRLEAGPRRPAGAAAVHRRGHHRAGARGRPEADHVSRRDEGRTGPRHEGPGSGPQADLRDRGSSRSSATRSPRKTRRTSCASRRRPKSWGPTYLKLGLALGTDFQFTTEFGVVGARGRDGAQPARRPVEDDVHRRRAPSISSRASISRSTTRDISSRRPTAAGGSRTRRSSSTRSPSAPTRSPAPPWASTSATTSGPGESCASATCGPSGRARARSATPFSRT